MHRSLRRPDAALVLASISLFLALGGGAYAAGAQGGAKAGPRVSAITAGTGDVIARAGDVRLERPAGGNGMQVRNGGTGIATFACVGTNSLTPGAVTLAQGTLPGGDAHLILTDGIEPKLITCRIADRASGATTEAVFGYDGGSTYRGHALSDERQG